MESPHKIVVLGVKSTVMAFDRETGARLWTTRLGGSLGDGFTTVAADATRVYAHARGEMHCLDLATGALLWKDALTGLGYGIASIAFPGGASSVAAQQAALNQATQQAATAAPP